VQMRLPCVAIAFLMASPVLAEDPEVTAIMLANPDPFSDLDMLAVLERYGSGGSGIDLVLGSIPLVLSTEDLVSDISSIDGATDIISDPNGFGFTIGLSGDFLFEFDEYALTVDARETLSEVIALYNEYDGTEVSIEGHTDSKGSDTYNQTLSEQRADVVYQWFLDNGIDNEMITARGFGETRPIADNEVNDLDNPAGRALNRRVDIHITTLKRVNFVPLAEN